MKRLLQIIATAILGIGLTTAMVGVASADCSIVNTGAGSDNTCTTTGTNDLVVTCTNNADVVSVNGQSAGSGSVTLNGNTNGGYSYSGTAVNTNATTNLLDVGCGPAVAAATTTAPATTSTPAAKTVAPTATPAAQTATPAVAALPETGSNTALDATIAGVAGLGVVLTVSRFGFLSFRRHSLK